MSLSFAVSAGDSQGFPRVSGDEPRIVPTQYGATMFSPRERG